ncbi:50S ribosomal protein L17 [Puniceicoccales bacterium CK1056]|uniref:Large ribosomal subunit protein bL17 n=1 Tax=Oceanipulchritudo coccoides TaxID=2706888 RepID=A0A6B2M185_9BACT|nr:50S ribosomal protein L17 [Oceanipulchritudo coccoides]NDV62668.1 50S ribosomal protein L17 [Oceanipulchritudo coccoides]
MRHLKHRFQLGRKKEHRIATMSNLGAALLRHGRIQTTLPKAKALRPFIEKIITLAKKADGASPEKALHYRRLAASRVRDKEAVGILFNEKASFFSNRPGGYTRIYKLGNRIGDAAEMAVIQLIPAEDEGYAKKPRKARPSKAEKPAAAKEETPVEEPVAEEASDSEAETSETAEPVAEAADEGEKKE